MEQRTNHRTRVVALLLAAMSCLVATAVVSVPHATASTIDGQYSGLGAIGPNGTLHLTVIGRGGVPLSGAGSVALNVTATNPTAPSYLTIYPTGSTRPTASNLNYTPGQTTPNMVIVPIGANGQISLYNYAGTVDVIVDVLGWFPTGNTYTGLNPARLLDTRPGLATIDNTNVGTGPVTPDGTYNLPVTGRGGIPATGAGSVALNVTATNPTAPSYLTIYPTGSTRPTASNLNYTPGQTTPNMVIVPIGANGQISLYNYAGTVDVIVDVLGWFPTGNTYTGLNPARLLDTRPGLATIDNTNVGTGPVTPDGTYNLPVTGRGGIPATGAGSVALNVTATNPTAPSYLTIYPTGSTRPTASNLNYTPGQTTPNMVIVPIGANGQISLYNYAGTVDVIVDVLGWFPTGNTYTGLNPARLLDTRPEPPAPPAVAGPIRNLLVVTPGGQQMTGLDRIAVWVCDVPANTTSPFYAGSAASPHAVDPQAVASWAQQAVAPYFAGASSGRYRVTFVALGRIALTTTDGTVDCLDKAVAATPSPYTNVFVTDTSGHGSGFGSPGWISSYEPDNYFDFTKPPSQTQRGLWIGGFSIVENVAPDILVHEIGHTLKWPHSYTGQGDEYNNRVDVMSGQPDEGWCSRSEPGGFTIEWPCVPQNTLAFNRFAAGWIDDHQVQLQQSGSNAFALDAPAGSGTQMIAAPDPGDPTVMLTLEARPRTGNDSALPVEGVVAHVIDQRPSACFAPFANGACTGTERRQSPALGGPDSYDHVLRVGTTTVINGVTVTVTAQNGNTFTGSVSGTFHAPSGDQSAVADDRSDEVDGRSDEVDGPSRWRPILAVTPPL